MKAFAYLRVSGLSQTGDDKDGFPRQRVAITEFALKNDLEIVEEFLEKGVSGTTDVEDRPALGELLAALEANGVRTIVIEKVDRLARDLLIQESIIGDLQRKGFTLLSTMEPDLCSTEPSRVFIRQVFGALAQLDRATIQAKLNAARKRKRQNDPAYREGKRPYGALLGEANTLALMRQLRTELKAYQDVADSLNSRGIMARGGKPWKVGTIAKILSREN